MVATPDQTWIQIHPTVDCQWFRIINGNVKKGRNRPSLRDLRVGCWWNQKSSDHQKSIQVDNSVFRPFNSHETQNHSTCQCASIWHFARFTARRLDTARFTKSDSGQMQWVASTKRVMVLKIKLTRQNRSKWPSPSRHKRHVARLARLNHGSVKKTLRHGMTAAQSSSQVGLETSTDIRISSFQVGSWYMLIQDCAFATLVSMNLAGLWIIIFHRTGAMTKPTLKLQQCDYNRWR